MIEEFLDPGTNLRRHHPQQD